MTHLIQEGNYKETHKCMHMYTRKASIQHKNSCEDVFWIVTPCRLARGYQHFRETPTS